MVNAHMPHCAHFHRAEQVLGWQCLQAYLLFRAALAEPYTFGAGPESLEVKLVAPEEIKWEQVCLK